MISSVKKHPLAKVLVAAILCAGFSVAAQANVFNLGTLSVPSPHSFSDSFGIPGVPGAQFIDDYTFTIATDATFGSSASTTDSASFRIDNLQALLYAGTGPFVPGTTPLLQVFSTGFSFGSTTGETVVITPLALSAGAYTLELVGNIDGSSGGTYAGNFNVSPVPEPSSALAILAGLGLLGFQLRRKTGLRGED